MSEKISPGRAATTSAEYAVPRHSSLFIRQAAFVSTMILLTGLGLTLAGYLFARLIIDDQIRVRSAGGGHGTARQPAGVHRTPGRTHAAVRQ